jgi:tetratricopeptide (TPR) repeat protein
VAIRFSPNGRVRRPDARVLVYLEGLLRALAETSEDEMDQGRWVRQVVTYDGPAAYRFAMPHLLEAPRAGSRPGLVDRRAMERATLEIDRFMARSAFHDIEQANEALRRHFSGPLDAIPSTASTPLEKAQDVAYQAFAARGRLRVKLAREALALSHDCADAYVILAEQTGDLAQAREIYAQGVAAGERALGPQIFTAEVGRFWGLVTTRPYMRARFGLAQCLETIGQIDEAIGHYRELLRLNPDDNQGVRYSLLTALLARSRDDDAGALLSQFRDDPSALWRFGHALWMFRREGDSPAARESLGQALRANRHVRKYLAGKEPLPETDPPSSAFGSEEEAIIFARALSGVWRATRGAREWLRTATRARKSPKRRRP